MSARKPGRPAIGPLVSFSIRPDQKKQIEALASLWDVPQSWVVRYLFDQSLPRITTNALNPFTTEVVRDAERAVVA